MSKKPSEYFRSNWYATFWFEENQGDLQSMIDKVGDERILFETDFPHPTCLYPAPLNSMAEKMNGLRAETRRRIMGENAARLYRL
jgi:predicted TIM-barrel fold metal-dependent hydrolase